MICVPQRQVRLPEAGEWIYHARLEAKSRATEPGFLFCKVPGTPFEPMARDGNDRILPPAPQHTHHRPTGLMDVDHVVWSAHSPRGADSCAHQPREGETPPSPPDQFGHVFGAQIVDHVAGRRQLVVNQAHNAAHSARALAWNIVGHKDPERPSHGTGQASGATIRYTIEARMDSSRASSLSPIPYHRMGILIPEVLMNRLPPGTLAGTE